MAYDRRRIPGRHYHAYKISSEKNKKCRSIDVDKVGSKKTFSEWMLFRVGLIGSSFLDLISKQARLNAVVRSEHHHLWSEHHHLCSVMVTRFLKEKITLLLLNHVRCCANKRPGRFRSILRWESVYFLTTKLIWLWQFIFTYQIQKKGFLSTIWFVYDLN